MLSMTEVMPDGRVWYAWGMRYHTRERPPATNVYLEGSYDPIVVYGLDWTFRKRG